jgi:membrane associated rhomboid family serine protease/Zn-finger nucleic acid-binding protein
MFACPHCAQPLQQQRGPHGVIWLCPVCKGHAASLGVLRKVFGTERVGTIWGESCRDDVERGCACPVCQGATARVTWLEQGKPLAVDLCRRCEFVWFDPNEYESIAPAPPPEHVLGDVDLKSLPIDLREQLAMDRVREIARQANKMGEEPEELWKAVPAILGLPVEVDMSSPMHPPIGTYLIATLISVVTLVAFLFANAAHRNMASEFGLISSDPWRMHGLTFLTSFFLHASLFHLVGNLYFLIVFGRQVEEYLGIWRWLLLLAVSALVGDLVDITWAGHGIVPLVGASGGISGLLAFYAFKLPYARLALFYGLMGWLTLPAWGMLALWVMTQLWGAYLELQHVGNVASLAHLGGVVAGFAFWLLWRNLDSKPAPGAISSFPAVTVR